jgi:hypothetical protein
MTFFTNIGTDHHAGRKAVQGVFVSDFEFTSALTVYPYQTVNVGIMIGSQVSDILSAKGGVGGSVVIGSAISGIFSTASMSITLQRQYPEEMGSSFWHDVDSWSVTVAEAEGASSENISDKSEPETMMYRVGVKTGEYESGLALVRLGTS